MVMEATDIRNLLKRMPYIIRVGNIPGGLSEFISIQDAINYAASQGGNWVIYIYPGIYDEQVTCADGVDLRGVGARGSVIIQQTDANVVILGDNVEIKNVTVRLVTPTQARQLVYDNATAYTATLEDVNFEITTPGAFSHALMRFYGAGDYTVRGCFASIGACGANFYTIEHDQNAGTLHLFNNDFTAATGGHIRCGVAGNITGGQNRWAGACGMWSVVNGTITLDGDQIVCTGGATGDVIGGAVNVREGLTTYHVYPGMMIQHALTAGAGLEVVVHAGSYAPTANLTVAANTEVRGEGKATVITATGAAITNALVLNGNNITIKDLKIGLAAGAGAGGSRPNVVYASGVTLIWLESLWVIGDTSVADDGSNNRQCGISFATVTDSKIINCRSEDSKRHGIYLSTSSNYNTVADNTCQGNSQYGILMIGTSNYNTAAGNTCEGNKDGIYLYTSHNNTVTGNTCEGNSSECGIYVFGSENNTITGNTCRDNGWQGILVTSSSHNNTITGNNCRSNDECGIYLSGSDNNTITGNTCRGNDPGGSTWAGIRIEASDENTITGNTCDVNGLHGIHVYRSRHNTIAGNTCNNQNTGNGIMVEGDATKSSDDNQVAANNCYNNSGYGIEISGGANADSNRVINNILIGNTTAQFADGGTNTQLATYMVPFSHGSDPQDSGFLIDANTEYARAWLRLPPEVQQVVRLQIWARSVILEADAMRLEINVNGGADNQAFNTHATAAPNTPSTTTNFAADDVIHWTLTSAQIVALLGGDSVEVKVLHEAAGDGDCATNAYMRSVEIQYV